MGCTLINIKHVNSTKAVNKVQSFKFQLKVFTQIFNVKLYKLYI